MKPDELPELIVRLLTARGITGEKAIEEFFAPSLRNLVRPTELPGISEAVEAILAAEGLVVVFGDYDCDGICATAITVSCLKAIRPDLMVVPFLPDRLTEGYGMSEASVARLLREQPDVRLVITVDNGINSVDRVAELKARGIRVVVTDHHLPGETLPSADAVVNPKVASPEALSGLCGAGVAFLLANALVSEAKNRGLYAGPNIGGPLLVLAGLATVTDIMPLVGQNRILVAEALKKFRLWAPIGLRELLDRASRSGVARLTTKDFGFTIGPRINAAGRMASGLEALELILSDDREIARELARIVDNHNVDRKTIEQKMTEEAIAKIVPDAPAQVIELPDGHPGIAGIVASRIMEKLDDRVPVCVIAGGHGSARAPDGLNIRDAFEACREVLVQYGGHAAAGGFSVAEGQVDRFREMLAAYCRALPESSDRVRRPDEPDFWVEPTALTVELAEWLERMEPFGEGNPVPIFGVRNVVFADIRQLGAEGKHLQASFRDRRLPRAVWWNHGDLVEELRRDSFRPRDILFAVELSDYGERHVELRLTGLSDARKTTM